VRRTLGSILAVLALTANAHAASPPPKSVTHEYSAYEKESIRIALAQTGSEIEPSPEGKTIEAYDVVNLDVFEKRDPVPTIFNVFHWTSRPYTISRERLADVGDRYQKVIIDETARNLRKLSGQLSLVIVVAVKGKQPNSVRVLMITKDVWSLRLNSNFRYAGGALEQFYLQPSEQNVFGTHHVAAVDFFLQPLSYALGGYYKIPWVAGTRWQAIAEAGVVMNREQKTPEGSYGNLIAAYPLWSTRTDWSAEARVQWRNDVFRGYSNGRAIFDRRRVPGDDNIPYEIKRRVLLARAEVLRSFGWALKNDVTLGFQTHAFKYETRDLSTYDPEAVTAFNALVPRSDTRVGPYVQWHTYKNDYLRVLDVEILALQEDFRLGHDFIARVYPVTRALGSTRDFIGLDLRGQYTLPLGDGMIRGSLESNVEAQRDRVTDSQLEGRLRIVSPRTGFGRLFFDGGFVRRFRNFLRDNTALGSETRPRGYPTRFLIGPNAVAYTMEFRTKPIDILKTQWALVAFHDAASAYESVSELKMHHSVGAGLRVLFPQFDRVAFRLDVGVPVRSPTPIPQPWSMIFTVGQAFSFPSIRENTTLD
jgi:hypothetical protein